VIQILEECFGSSVNSMGYKLLPSYLRIIQGDGIDLGSIEQVTANAFLCAQHLLKAYY
jgi:nicotinamide phosphoribosyltransferase